jgi:hypothetical protein
MSGHGRRRLGLLRQPKVVSDGDFTGAMPDIAKQRLFSKHQVALTIAHRTTLIAFQLKAARR